jgi:hypothetical protein
MHLSSLAMPQRLQVVLFASFSTFSRARAVLIALLMAAAIFPLSPALALVVEDMTGTTVPPTDDPGWNYHTIAGPVGNVGRDFVYLGDSWALSAFHVGLPDLESDPLDNPEDPNSDDELIHFAAGSFYRIKGQAFTVPNPSGSGLSALTDLRLIRLNGDPGLPDIQIASQEIVESSAAGLKDVTFIGRGPTRWDNPTNWRSTVVPPANSNNDTWTESCGGPGQSACNQSGYKSVDGDTKRWGTNQLADEDTRFGENDSNLRGTVTLRIAGADRHIVSLVTKFDSGGAGTAEAQAVGGDSGSSVFHKRDGVWELLGIVNAVLPPDGLDSLPNTGAAVYGNYTTFADLTYYRNEIMNIINANPYFSLLV